MVTLRLARAGTKKRPVYHVVATDSRNRRDGSFLEKLGYFIPEKNVLVLKGDRVEHWLKVGALPSETVLHLIKQNKKAPAPAAEARA
jgi:small subunit ribosomal protein S16